MAQYINKEALVAWIKSLKFAAETMLTGKTDLSYWEAQRCLCERFLSFIDTLEVKEISDKYDGFFGKELKMIDDEINRLERLKVKEVDIYKLCEFRKNIGFAYPEGASEYQKQLACYRQGIKDAIKAQKGE